jgi:hypothetical protein
MQWDEWQQEILDYKGNIVLCTGRQVGKTTIFSEKAARRMLEKKTQIVVVSLTEDQAQLIILMVLTSLERLAKNQIKQGNERPTKNKITLKNGSSILSRPVGITGNSVRGFTGDVLIIDEASQMGEIVFSSVKPILLTRVSEIWMSSTPKGRKGYFYECFNNTERFKVWHKSSVDVVYNRPISESWTEEQRASAINFIENERKDMSKTRFGQEYMGMFMDELQQFYPDDLILKQMKRKRPDGVQQSFPNFLGADLARMGKDFSVFSIGYVKNRRIIQVENLVTKKTRLTESAKLMIDLTKLWNLEKLYIDDEGIGVGVFDMLMDNEDTRSKVVSINNSKRMTDYKNEKETTIFKEVLHTNLLKMFEMDEFELLDDTDIFTSLKSVQYEYTEDTKGRPVMKIFGNNTHHAEALTRLGWAVKAKDSNIWIKSI